MCSVDFTRFAGRVARKKFNARNRLEVNGRAVGKGHRARFLYFAFQPSTPKRNANIKLSKPGTESSLEEERLGSLRRVFEGIALWPCIFFPERLDVAELLLAELLLADMLMRPARVQE